MVNEHVKRVPDAWHAALKQRAVARGISLNELLLEVLEASLPSLDEWNQRVADLAARIDLDDEGRARLHDQTFWDEVKGRWPDEQSSSTPA